MRDLGRHGQVGAKGPVSALFDFMQLVEYQMDHCHNLKLFIALNQ